MEGVIKGDWGLGYWPAGGWQGIEALWAVENFTVGSGDAIPIDDDEAALGQNDVACC
jgi:hypothetical protein